MFKSKHSYADFIEGMLVGGSLGAAATFMLGTEQGKKLQKEMMKKCKMLGSKVEHYRDNIERAVKSPAAKKLKRLAKKAVRSQVARKVVSKARSATRKKATRR